MSIENHSGNLTLRYRHTVSCLRADGFGLENGNSGKINFREFIGSSPDAAKGLLTQRLHHLINGLHVLNNDDKNGVFNRHDSIHLEALQSDSQGLLTVANPRTSDTDRNIATAIVYLHDLGNNLSRHNHHELSVELFPKIFNNFSYDDPVVNSILMGIYLHDEAGYYVEDFSRLSSDLHREPIWSVIIADKADISRRRLSRALLEELAVSPTTIVDINPHTVLVLFAKERQLAYDPYTGTMTLRIEFSNKADEDSNPVVKQILEKFKWRDDIEDIRAPKQWYDRFVGENSPYVHAYISLLETVYCERLALMNSCLFALLPNLRLVQLYVEDKNSWIDSVATERYRRDSWQQALFFAWKQKHKADFKAGEITPPPILEKGHRKWTEEHKK